MTNYLTISLDTTAPEVHINAPHYTLPNIPTYVEVSANESLSSIADIYIVDSEGSRFDLSLSYDGDRFSGFVYLNNLAKGTATIYADVRDEVWNEAQTAFKHIEMLQFHWITVELKASVRPITLKENGRDV